MICNISKFKFKLFHLPTQFANDRKKTLASLLKICCVITRTRKSNKEKISAISNLHLKSGREVSSVSTSEWRRNSWVHIKTWCFPMWANLNTSLAKHKQNFSRDGVECSQRVLIDWLCKFFLIFKSVCAIFNGFYSLLALSHLLPTQW